MSYNRDSAKDLVWDDASGTYIPAPVAKPEHLYGWYKYGNMLLGQDIVYTASSTPSTGDYVFDNTGTYTGYRVQHIISENSISIAECLVMFRLITNVEGEIINPVGFNFTIDGVTTHNPIISTQLGKTIAYEIYVKGFAIRTGTIVTSEAYQIIDINIHDDNTSYTISYDSDAYTAEPTEGVGLVITATTKTTVDLGTDFVITEN